MLHDNRTLPEGQWTYYVVDHLPTMANIYRFDTVEEAIAKYQSLPKTQNSAIGSSIHGTHEIDHVHRRDGHNVLVMDAQNVKSSLWRDSKEIQDAIDKMISHLNIRHQYMNIGGPAFPSVVVDLAHSKKGLDNYFSDKILRPDNSQNLDSAIEEVYVEGSGWLSRDAFLKELTNSRPGRQGEGAKNLFVGKLNVKYMNSKGHEGQADLTARDFAFLKEKTERLLSPEKLASDLYEFAQLADPYEYSDQADIQDAELEAMQKNISQGVFSPYVKYITDALSEGLDDADGRSKAIFLLSRLDVLTPKELRKPSLAHRISMADRAAHEQQGAHGRPKQTDLER